VSGTSRCLFSDKYKTHKYSVGREYSCWMLNCWCITWPVGFKRLIMHKSRVESSWNMMAHGDAREEKWRGNKRMVWVTSKRHMTAEHRLARAVQILQACVHSSPASTRLNWRPRQFKWTRPFRPKTKSGFWACAITFQMQSTIEGVVDGSIRV